MVSLGKPLPEGPGHARAIEPMPRTERLNISVSLQYRDPVGMQRFVDQVANPKSPNYRHFLTPEEVGRRFGPTPETLRQVQAYLTQNGIRVNLVGKNGLTILAEATVGQAEAAFQTKLNCFEPSNQYPGLHGRLFCYATSPSVPAYLRPYILDVGGLESFTHPKPLNYVTPTQIQTLYDLAPMLSSGVQGQGRTVAISSWDGYRLANVPHEYSQFGLPAPSGGVGSNITVKTIDGGTGGGNEQGEADLDIQSILAVSPQCNLVIYDGAGGDLINVLTHEANDNIADIISESYGWSIDPNTKLSAHNLHLSMSAQGITYMAASGDSGTTLSYVYPNIEPEVLMVGGTTNLTDVNGNRINETGWSGSGGGWAPTTDPFNTLPSYQAGNGVPTNIPYRLIPDVALNADPGSGYVVYLLGNFYVIGGTSGASPTFAGSLATSEQQLIANGSLPANATGTYRFGRIQDLLYSFNGSSSLFFDVTSGSNGKLPNGSTSQAGPGWDFVTGWGALDFNAFVNQLSVTGLTQFTLSPTSVPGGTNVTATVATATLAPSAGTVITLSGGDGNVTYPATVTIPAGSRSTTFTITTTAVTSVDSEALSASDGTVTKNATLTLNPVAISTFTVAPTSAIGGATFTATVNLTQAASQPSGLVVNLSGGDASISYPSTVTVPQGAQSATFNITSNLTANNDVETLTATLGASTQTASFTLTGLSVSSLTFSPTSLAAGGTTTATVTLSTAAPTGGETVTLSGGDSSISYPSTVSVAANSKTATFTVTTSASAVGASTESLTASLGSSSASGSFTLTGITVSTLSLSPNSVFGGQSSTGTVTLAKAAGSSGVVVALSGGDSSVAYPATVTVPANSKTATFTVTTSVVASSDAETLSATLGSSVVTSVLTVKPAGVVSTLTFSPTSVVGGKTTTGTVKLTGVAGPSGVTVTLSGGDSNVSYPASVNIASGATSGTFTVTATQVSTNVSETLTATIGPSSASGTLTITATSVSGLTMNPTSIFGGQGATGTVTLNGPAGAQGTAVALSGGDSSISFPTSVTVAAGATSATFAITSSVVPVNTTETITATLNSVAKAASLTLKPAGVVSTLTFSPTSIVGGKTSTGTVKLTGGAGPSGVTVTLSGGDSNVSYPATITIASGATSGTFTVTASQVATNTTESITATIGPSSAAASLTITATTVTGLTVSPTSIFGGQGSTGTVTLNGPAGAQGTAVALSGGDTSISYPSSVTVAAGATSATFAITSSTVSVNTSEALTASLNSTKSATLTLKPAGVVSSLTFSPTSIVGGTNSVGTIKLTGPAGPNGVTVTLTGGDSNIAYPATLSIAAGASSATFTVTSTQVTSSAAEALTATIGPSSASATLTVQATTVSSFAISPTSVYGSQSATGTITLNGPAGAQGTTVALSGGDSSVSYPSSVTVAQGATSATFAITTSVVSVNTAEPLTASLNSSTKSATLSLKPAGVVSTLTFAPTTIVGGNSSVGTVKLTGPAGPAGVTVTLSGGDSNISYPSSVSIVAGATSATFTVTSTQLTSSDAEVLTATIGPSSANGTLTVSATAVSSVSLSPTSVFGGQSSTGTITLNGPAGSQGATVTLSGGDSSVSYPSTVTVAAGATSATFSITTSIVAVNTSEVLSAGLNSGSKSATLTVKPAGIVSSMSFSPSSIAAGTNTTGTINLTSAAGPSGVTVTLSGGDANVSYPTSVSIAAGATSATFTLTSSAVSVSTAEPITATIGPSSAKATVTLVPPTLVSLTFSSAYLYDGASGTGTVTLSGPAGPNGITVTILGGDAYVNYPTTVTIAAGASSGTFTIGSSVSTVNRSEQITAKYGGNTKTATITVLKP